MTLREEIESMVGLLIEAKIIAYHGTCTKFTRSILKQGFIPNPKTKIWDAGFLQSYHGIYFTTNWGTAYGASGNAYRKFGGNRAIFEVQVETRTAMPDEDDLKTPIQLLGLVMRIDVTRAGLEYQGWEDKDLIQQSWDIFKRYLQAKMQQGSTSDREWNAVFPEFKDWMQTGIDIVRNADEYRKSFPSQFAHPDLRAGMVKVMKKLKWLVSRMGQETGDSGTLRITEPITFRGANRILNAVEIIDTVGKVASSEENPYILRPLYGKVSSEFIKQFESRVGGTYRIER